MYLPFFSLSAPCHSAISVSISISCPSHLSLSALHARIVIEAFSHFIRLCCRLEDPANRPSLHLGWPANRLSPSLSPCTPRISGQAEIYAHMLSTLFAFKREGGKDVRPFWGWLFILFLCKTCEGLLRLQLLLPLPFPLTSPPCIVVRFVRASFRLLWHFSYAFLLVF